MNGEALVGGVKQGAKADLTGPSPAVVKSEHVFSLQWEVLKYCKQGIKVTSCTLLKSTILTTT